MNNGFIVNTGKVIKEYLDEQGISQKELALRTNTSEKHISNMLKGKCRLTEEMALKLEFVMPQISASYWLNYEQKYREYLARVEQNNCFTNMDLKRISKKFYFSEVFKGLDWDIERQAYEMLKILSISDFSCFDSVYGRIQTAFMEDGGKKEPIVIWLKLCEEQIEIQNKDISKVVFAKKNVRERLDDFRKFTLIEDLDGVLVNCKKLCNKLGINLVVYPTITNCKVRGALKMYKGKPAIFLSGRFKTLDHIWFAFFHELGHLIMHYDEDYFRFSFEDDTSKDEEEANTFARNCLINPVEYQQFVKDKNRSINQGDIISFARSQRVHPGILVGRLQHEGIIEKNKFNGLKVSINMMEVFS